MYCFVFCWVRIVCFGCCGWMVFVVGFVFDYGAYGFCLGWLLLGFVLGWGVVLGC